jgi:predicted phosphohydrolase
MEVFGDVWNNYINKIKTSWNRVVRRKDLVIVAGDISWATTLEGGKKDFDFIEHELIGSVILSIGNHDFWHQTATKSHNWFFDHYRSMVPLIRNDYMPLGNQLAVCAVKGYMNENHPEFKEEYRKSYERECRRLESTLKSIPSEFEIIVVSHYPPLHRGFKKRGNRVIDIMKKYNVTECLYGHLHGEQVKEAFNGTHAGIDFRFVAADSNGFEPIVIRKAI